MDVDIIINRNARQLVREGPVLRTLLAAARRGRARVHQTRTLGELERIAQELGTRGSSAVILAGGDGSHMAGVSALARAFGGALPALALVPGGTVCTVARNFGMSGNIRRWTERVVGAVCAGHTRIVRKATLRVRDGANPARVGFIFGAGLVTRFFDIYDQSRAGGLRAAAWIGARVFAGSFVGSSLALRVLERAPAAVRVDGVLHECGQWSLILASVVRNLGLHLRPTYRAGGALDQFHVVASGLAPRALGPQIFRVMAGRPIRGEPTIDALAHSLDVRFRSPADGYVLDGDVVHAGEAHVETGPVLPLLIVAPGSSR